MNLTKYIGRPYEKYHCFDLVKEVYLDFFNLSLSNYYESKDIPANSTIQSLIISNKGDFVKVDQPQFGDIVVIKLFGYSCHIGVCIGEGKFLHSIRKVGSCVDNLKRYEKLIDGYYRHREKTA